MRVHQFKFSAVVLSFLLAACASPIATSIQATPAILAKYNELSALDVVTAFEKNVNEAKDAGMPFTAPHYFQEASALLSESQAGLSSKPKEQLVQQAARGDAILEKGRSVMAVVQYRFAKELELKTQLDKLNTANNLPKEYNNVIGNFSGLIEKVEREKADNIDKDKESLLNQLQALEVRAVQENALRVSEMINNDSKSKNAEKQIPATYAEALRIYQDAKTQIAAAHHDDELVQRLGSQALFAAHHAQQLNDRVIELQVQFKGAATAADKDAERLKAQNGAPPAVEKSAVEKIALREEDRLLTISTALGQKDLRDLPLEKQVQEIKLIAADLAVQAKNEVGIAAMKDLETRLKSANDATQQAMVQLADKDKKLTDKDAQLTDKDAQLADKDAQIAKLNEEISTLESKGKSKH